MKELLFLYLCLSLLYIFFVIARSIVYIIIKPSMYNFWEYVFYEELLILEYQSILFIIFCVIQGLALSVVVSNLIIY